MRVVGHLVPLAVVLSTEPGAIKELDPRSTWHKLHTKYLIVLRGRVGTDQREIFDRWVHAEQAIVILHLGQHISRSLALIYHKLVEFSVRTRMHRVQFFNLDPVANLLVSDDIEVKQRRALFDDFPISLVLNREGDHELIRQCV